METLVILAHEYPVIYWLTVGCFIVGVLLIVYAQVLMLKEFRRRNIEDLKSRDEAIIQEVIRRMKEDK